MNIFDRIKENKERSFFLRHHNFIERPVASTFENIRLQTRAEAMQELQLELERALENNDAIFVLAYHQLIYQGYNITQLNRYDVIRRVNELRNNNIRMWY